MSIRVGLAALVGLAACGPDSSDALDGSFDTSQLPTVTAELELQVGAVDDPGYDMTRFVVMELDHSGRAFTLHPQEQVVRIFSPEGELERVFGGRGEGPGEFMTPVAMGWVADSLWVLDAKNGRFSYFDSVGEYHHSFTVPFEPDQAGDGLPPQAEGLLSDGRVYGSPPVRPLGSDVSAQTERIWTILRRDGSIADTVTTIPIGATTWAVRILGRNMFFVQPFTGRPTETVQYGEEALVIMDPRLDVESDSATYLVSKVEFTGDTLFSVRLRARPVPVTDAQVEQAVDRNVTTLGNLFGLGPADARALLRETLVRPRVRPGAQDLVVTRSGEIWVQEVAISPNGQWVVLTPGGEPVFRVEVPGPVDVIVAGESEVWGRLEDGLGVPYLVRYRFRRP